MAHVGQEPAFQIGGLPQLLGLGVEFGIQGKNALVGFLELGAQQFVFAAQFFNSLGLRALRRHRINHR